ncbi:MAG: neutral/alkaline non-lysosomal ceramidase N-terminal domain-containing protein [Acidobacteria bacterium]|nr:neutral/alkaline non-lysosomal ceramidase N-terminal domain-containing protein [Acidobacteriota bacterium]
MKHALLLGLTLIALLLFTGRPGELSQASAPVLKAGAAAVVVTPFGQHADWDGQMSATGVWGEKFEDKNGNGVWDGGEPFVDDPGNTELDASSKNKYDGIYLAGFGDKRLASGRHDDLWARTVVLDYGSTRIAIVSIDFIGYYSEGRYYGINQIQKMLDPKLGIQEILLSSTHSHEGPDTIGAWGDGPLKDGKYPKYLRFLDRQIAKSINMAARSLEPVRIKLGQTDPERSPAIAGMQTRTGGRPPKFFDQELRVMQFVGTAGKMRGKAVATIVNWNTHPESMENKNTYLTSDFPHAIRESVEKRYGGTALYINGAIGTAEIIGDTNNKNNDRIRFDGQDFPLKENNNRPVFTFDRTEAIGRDVAKAAIEALDRGEWSKNNSLSVKKADLKGPMDNQGYAFLAKLGVFDTIPLTDDGTMPEVKTTIYALDLGDAQIVTTPGELFPEVFYGVAKHKRTDCPQADTGAPPEPSIRDAMTAKYRFMFGLCPDEFGYIVPKYDWRREPVDLKKMQIRETADPCRDKGVPNHYHETNSASSEFAPASACVSVALLTGKIPTDPACANVTKHSDFVKRLAAKNARK